MFVRQRSRSSATEPGLLSVGRKRVTAKRRRILQAAFAEFYRTGFQGDSLNHIVDEANTTKGALFYHFKDRNDLGYAVVEEIILPRIKAIGVTNRRLIGMILLQAFTVGLTGFATSGLWSFGRWEMKPRSV